jgi:hypothetical protein
MPATAVEIEPGILAHNRPPTVIVSPDAVSFHNIFADDGGNVFWKPGGSMIIGADKNIMDTRHPHIGMLFQ